MPPISFGRERISPKKLQTPLMRESTLRETTFPIAIWLRLTGVTSMVANVPRSFSPAIDSGATAIQPEKRNMRMSMGPIIEKIMPVVSFSEAKSCGAVRKKGVTSC